METAKEIIKRVERDFIKIEFKDGESYISTHDRLMAEAIDEFAAKKCIEVLKEILNKPEQFAASNILDKISELEKKLKP
jgi:hydrogenase maturation factor